MWTRFMDMHTGGFPKQPPYDYIFIEAPEEKAIEIFYDQFGHDPLTIGCYCCGQNYSIDENKTLKLATAYDRGCTYDNKTKEYIEEWNGHSWSKYLTLEQFKKMPNVLIVSKRKLINKEN